MRCFNDGNRGSGFKGHRTVELVDNLNNLWLPTCALALGRYRPRCDWTPKLLISMSQPKKIRTSKSRDMESVRGIRSPLMSVRIWGTRGDNAMERPKYSRQRGHVLFHQLTVPRAVVGRVSHSGACNNVEVSQGSIGAFMGIDSYPTENQLISRRTGNLKRDLACGITNTAWGCS